MFQSWCHCNFFLSIHIHSQISIQKEASELVKHFEKQDGRPMKLGSEITVAILNIIWQMTASKFPVNVWYSFHYPSEMPVYHLN